MTVLLFLPQILIVHLLVTRPCPPGEAEMLTQQVSALGEPPEEQGMGVGHEIVRGGGEGAQGRLVCGVGVSAPTSPCSV